MNGFIMGPLPLWAEILTAVFAVARRRLRRHRLVRAGAPAHLLPPHPCADAGRDAGRLVHHARRPSSISRCRAAACSCTPSLIALFVALTAPVTTIFLMRAALFRERQKGSDVPKADPKER